MKTVKAIYLYDLNEWARIYSEVPVGKLIFSISRTKQGSARYGKNNDHLKNDALMGFLETFMRSFKSNIKDSLYKICIILNNLKN